LTYADILARFDPVQNVAITHVLLLEQAISAGAVPQAYLCCVMSQGQIKIYCLHMPSRFTSSLDGRKTLWDGKVFAFLRELTQGIATTVELPDNAFRLVVNTRTQTYEYIRDHPDELLRTEKPYLLNNKDDTAVNSTCSLMYLPGKYAALLLRPSGYDI